MNEVKAEIIDLTKLIRQRRDCELAADLEPIGEILFNVIDNHGLAKEELKAILDAIFEGLDDLYDD